MPGCAEIAHLVLPPVLPRVRPHAIAGDASVAETERGHRMRPRSNPPSLTMNGGLPRYLAASRALLLGEVLNLEDLRFGRKLDPHVAEDRHQLLTVCLERLPRTPDLADT